jgi:O-antigen ligase
MGANFRPYLSEIDGWGSMGPHYTHNGHLWIAMKAGLLSWFSLLIFMVAFIVEGFKNWRKVIDPNKQSLALGFTLVGVSIIIGSILHPIIMTLAWTPLLGIIFGINHVIFKLQRQDE